MLVDEYEKYNNEQQDVVDINADETVEEAAIEPTADDCTLHAPYGGHFPILLGGPRWHVDRVDKMSILLQAMMIEPRLTRIHRRGHKVPRPS
jgi:hypothetical protein